MPSMETLLDAMVVARLDLAYDETALKWHKTEEWRQKRLRQYRAFRDRILRMDNRLNFTIGVALERGERILELEQQLAIREEDKWNLKDEIRYLKQQLAEKDVRIAELEKEVELCKDECSKKQLEIYELSNLDPTGQFYEPDW